MIAQISELKRTTTLKNVKSLCETTIAAMSSAIYNGVTPEARFEIERVATENLFEELSKYADDKLVSEWVSNQKRLFAIKNIGVRKAINTLKETDGKNDPTLSAILEQFEEKVNQYPEVLVYEEFISALAGEYNWVPGVSTQLDALSKRVATYKNDIDITKIIEVMKATRSNYLLPLIEDVVNNYLANKTDQTKSFLKETLVKFSYDPFVRDLINIVMLDAKDLQLEYANAEVDVDKVYSPLMYLGENEVAFNIKGTFYVKKGNNVNKLKKEDVANLDENFKALCEAINVPNVEFDRKSINVYVGDDKATINEGCVTVNGKEVTADEFQGMAEVSQFVGNTHFYALTEALRSNFDDIVEVDFAKRAYLKENEGHSADIIKLRNNIYITTYDPTNNKSTFYRNINPIQAEKVMMEHMRFDISKTFADILPNKEKILASIEETKKEYVEYINELNEKIEMFGRQGSSSITREVLDALKEELRDIKIEYKDYVNEMEAYTNISEGTTVTIDVDGEKYTVPIPQKTSTAKGEEADQEMGTVIGAEHMEDSPASEITFDDEKTELLGDSPSIQDDQIDLGVDNVEAEADAAEASAEDEEGVEGEEGAEADDLGLGDAEEETPEEETDTEDELGLGDEEEEPEAEEAEEEEYEEKKDISEEGDNDEEAEEIETEIDIEETPEAPEELEAGDLEGEDSEEEVEVEDADVKTKPANAPRVFLKKKVTESKSVKKKSKTLNENAQIGDTVKLNGDKGYVIGQTSDGDLIVQVQFSTHKVAPGKVKTLGEKKDPLVKPPYTFDDKTLQNLTTKALFEKFVSCGIYMGNTPVKLNGCSVKFSDWNNADDEKPIGVIIEGRTTILPKKQIRILEDINTFADPTPYAWGIYTNPHGESEDVLVNSEEFIGSYADAQGVTIIRNIDTTPEAVQVPKDRIQPNMNAEVDDSNVINEPAATEDFED